MVAERLSAVPSWFNKKEYTSRSLVPPLLWDCRALFLMDKITCVARVIRQVCVVDLFTEGSAKAQLGSASPAVEIPEEVEK